VKRVAEIVTQDYLTRFALQAAEATPSLSLEDCTTDPGSDNGDASRAESMAGLDSLVSKR
jgi:hypothetical protein